jgi:hypothetical protein
LGRVAVEGKMAVRNTEGSKVELRQLLADKEHPKLEEAMQLALVEGEALRALLDGLVSKEDAYRYNCFEVLLQISEGQPRVLYPEWDRFVELMGSGNAFHRSIALQLIANLTGADDEEGQFENLFDEYFNLLDDEKVMVARYLVQSAGQIARRKPHLREKIAEKLLDIDQTHHAEGRKALIKADAVEFFETFFEELPDKERVLAFIEGMLACSSPKARKAAKAFLNKHGHGRV